jgi:hypothetical protein
VENMQGMNNLSDALSATVERILPITGMVTNVPLIEKVAGKRRE